MYQEQKMYSYLTSGAGETGPKYDRITSPDETSLLNFKQVHVQHISKGNSDFIFYMSEDSFFKPDISIKSILQSPFMLLFANIVWAVMMGHILFNALKQEQKSLNSHFLVRIYTLIHP